MKPALRYSFLLLLTASILGSLVVGCKKPPEIPKGHVKAQGSDTDIFRIFADAVRYNPGTGDDWTRFKDALPALDAHFGKSDIITSLRLPDDDRKFLENEAHLSKDELAEVEATSFRKADAHYLDECFLLRDADQSLQTGNLPAIAQAHQHFRWVMRNVYLHEQGDDWMPPAFTLRRGWGNPVERAMLFLALLRQARMEGCLIATPDSEPVLVAVLEPKTTNLRLFDARLGLAVRGKDGKSIATLNEALADPSLLVPSGIGKDDVKKLQARLVCPLFALSPRMQELQDRLKAHDAVTLYLNARSLSQEIAKASGLTTTVWNPAPQGKKLPNSPTRALWMFLPKNDGGTDETGQRAAAFVQSRIPLGNVVANLALIRVTPEFVPGPAYVTLLKSAEDLFQKYELQPREMYLRGLYEPVFRRHWRMMPFLDSQMLQGLLTNREFLNKEMPKWINDVRTAYADVDPNDKQQARMRKATGAIFGQDAFVVRMLEVDRDDPLNRADKLAVQEKRELSKVLSVGTREIFDFELNRLQAACQHEKAERAQAALTALASPSETVRTRAETAWFDARGAWSNSYLSRTSARTKTDTGLAQLQRIDLAAIEFRLRLLETLHLDLQNYFNARLRLAECKAHTDKDGTKATAAYLEETRSEIESLERLGTLRAEIDTLRDNVRRLALTVQDPQDNLRLKLPRRLDLLARDWAERGNYYWMKQQIDRRLASSRP